MGNWVVYMVPWDLCMPAHLHQSTAYDLPCLLWCMVMIEIGGSNVWIWNEDDAHHPRYLRRYPGGRADAATRTERGRRGRDWRHTHGGDRRGTGRFGAARLDC